MLRDVCLEARNGLMNAVKSFSKIKEALIPDSDYHIREFIDSIAGNNPWDF
jgi:hypothetical protein